MLEPELQNQGGSVNDELSRNPVCRHCLDPRLLRTVGGLAQAGTITKDMQAYCTNDYKRFCGDYGLQTAALNLCIRKAGPSLSPACVNAQLDLADGLSP